MKLSSITVNTLECEWFFDQIECEDLIKKYGTVEKVIEYLQQTILHVTSFVVIVTG